MEGSEALASGSPLSSSSGPPTAEPAASAHGDASSSSASASTSERPAPAPGEIVNGRPLACAPNIDPGIAVGRAGLRRAAASVGQPEQQPRPLQLVLHECIHACMSRVRDKDLQSQQGANMIWLCCCEGTQVLYDNDGPKTACG